MRLPTSQKSVDVITILFTLLQSSICRKFTIRLRLCIWLKDVCSCFGLGIFLLIIFLELHLRISLHLLIYSQSSKEPFLGTYCVFSVTLLVKTVRFVARSYDEHLFTDIYVIPMVPDTQYLKRIHHP